jgi:hypothetical protein
MSKLGTLYRIKKYRYMLQINKYIYNLKCLILQHIIKDDVIEEYSIDKDLLHDYYNEEPEWSNDRD